MNADEAMRALRELDEPQPESAPPDTIDERIADAVRRGSSDPVTVAVRPLRTRRARRVLTGTVTSVGVAAVAAVVVVVAIVHHDTRQTQAQTPTSPALTDAARALLTRWDAVHSGATSPELIVTSELATQDGDWTGDDAGAEKLAFVDGQIDIAPGVTASGTPPTVVRWDDGTTAAATPLSPQAAITQAVTRTKADSGPSVPPLVVTSVTASSDTVSTTRGHATVPTWVLGLQDTTVRLVVVATTAFAPNPLDTQMPSRTDPEVGRNTVPIDSVSVSADGRTLTVSFVGAPHDARSPCGEDYTADVVADATAVVVIVQRQRYTDSRTDAANDKIFCTMQGASRQAVAHLDTSLASRPVLDIYTGQPVPAT